MKEKVIYITPFNIYPPTNGGERYIYNFIKSLSISNEVILIGLKEQTEVPINSLKRVYKVFNKSISKYISLTSYWKAYKIIQKENPKKIFVAMPYHAPFTILVSKYRKNKSILHEQNVEYLRFKRMRRWWWPLMYIYESFVYHFIDKVLYISDNDKTTILESFKINIKKVEHSPYIVDTSIFKPNNKSRTKIRESLGLINNPTVLFFGPLNYQPNSEALGIIQKKIAPETFSKNKKIKFLIVGKNPPNNSNLPNVIFKGYVEKIEDYINASDLVIVPLVSGGGVRTKILESLACSKKVISTSVGAEGIEINENNLVICDDFSKYTDILLSEINKK